MRARARTHTHTHTHTGGLFGAFQLWTHCCQLLHLHSVARSRHAFLSQARSHASGPRLHYRLLTLCPARPTGASSGPQGLYTAYTQAIHGLYTLPLAPSGIAPEQAPPRTYWPCVRAYTALVPRVLCVRGRHGTGAGLLSRCHAVLLSRCARLRHGDVRVGSVHCRPCRRRG